MHQNNVTLLLENSALVPTQFNVTLDHWRYAGAMQRHLTSTYLDCHWMALYHWRYAIGLHHAAINAEWYHATFYWFYFSIIAIGQCHIVFC
jgi:hypothetical protein